MTATPCVSACTGRNRCSRRWATRSAISPATSNSPNGLARPELEHRQQSLRDAARRMVRRRRRGRRMSSVGADEHKHEIIIVRHGHGDHDEGHHGGVWKIAFADFMTAMMCFFLVMWLINASNEQTKAAVASYFNPVRLIDRNSSRKGLDDIGDGPNAIGSETERPETLDATTRAEGLGKGGPEDIRNSKDSKDLTGAVRRTSVCRSLCRAGRDCRQYGCRPEHLAQGRRRRAELGPGDRRIRRRFLPRPVRAGFLDQAGRTHRTKPRPTGRRPPPRAP